MDDKILDDEWYKVPHSDGCYEWNREGSHYIHLDTNENAIDSLETAATFLARDDNLKWKWFALALHHSLYSFCIAALENGNYENVLEHRNNDIRIRKGNGSILKSVREPFYIKNYKTSAFRITWEQVSILPAKKVPGQKYKEKLISFWTALARVQDGVFWMNRLIIHKPLVLTDEEIVNIVWLADAVRNDIMHFTPKGYLIPIYDLLLCSRTYLRAIEFIALDSCGILFMNLEQSKKRITAAINQINENLNSAIIKMEKNNACKPIHK